MARLDDQELLRLAIEATRRDRHGDAIEYLKQAVEVSPKNATAHYLLAAEHAQLGLNDRAIEEFNRALTAEPNLQPARFQLGLLYLCNARVAEALGAWEPLGRLAESNEFRHFATGMQRLCQDDFTGCREALLRGMELNRTNPALNADMQRILDEMSARVQDKQAQQPGEKLISAYTRTLS
jgi:tetratricopeptide (TPR) repeat protein